MKSLLLSFVFCMTSPALYAQYGYSSRIAFDYKRQNAVFGIDEQTHKITSKCFTNIPGFGDSIVCGSAAIRKKRFLFFRATNSRPRFEIAIMGDSFKVKIDYNITHCGRAVSYTTRFKKAGLALNNTTYAVGDTLYGYFDCEFDRVPDLNPYVSDTGRYYFRMHFKSELEKGN